MTTNEQNRTGATLLIVFVFACWFIMMYTLMVRPTAIFPQCPQSPQMENSIPAERWSLGQSTPPTPAVQWYRTGEQNVDDPEHKGMGLSVRVWVLHQTAHQVSEHVQEPERCALVLESLAMHTQTMIPWPCE